MFSKLRVLDSGGTSMLVGDVVDISTLKKENREAEEAGKKTALAEQLLLGLSRVSLATDSWLAAASFQETIRVLVEASTTKKVDPLNGLKENVIIGSLIPAGEIYRQMFLSEEERQEEAAGAEENKEKEEKDSGGEEREEEEKAQKTRREQGKGRSERQGPRWIGCMWESAASRAEQTRARASSP